MDRTFTLVYVERSIVSVREASLVLFCGSKMEEKLDKFVERHKQLNDFDVLSQYQIYCALKLNICPTEFLPEDPV